IAVTRSNSVPSSATSVASVVADNSTSAAATAEAANKSARQSALPVLLGITSLPHLGLLLGESPGLQILLARAQGVEQPLCLGPIQGFLAARFGGGRLRLLLQVLLLLLRCMALGIVLLLRVRLLAGRCFLRSRLLLLPRSIALLRLGLLLGALLPRLVLARLSHRVLAGLPLRAQQQFQVHLRVHVVGVQREGGAVLADGLVRLAHRLGRQRQLVGRFRLQPRASRLQGPLRLARGVGRLRRIELQQRCCPVERDARIVGQAHARLVVLPQGAFRVVLRQQRIAQGDVAVVALAQPARDTAERLSQPCQEAGRFHLLRHDHHPVGRSEQEREHGPGHAGLRRNSGPSPSAAAAQSSTNAGQANQTYLSSYWTDSRDSNSPFCIFSSSGRNWRTPRSAPWPCSRRPLPRAVSSRRPATSVRVSTVRPCLSFL